MRHASHAGQPIGGAQAGDGAVRRRGALDGHRSGGGCGAVAGGRTTAWPQILKNVNTERAPRCNRILTTGRMWGELWHLDGTARIARNELFRTRGTSDHKYTDWLWGYASGR